MPATRRPAPPGAAVAALNPNITHVVASLVPESGGPSYAVPALAAALAARGAVIDLRTLAVGRAPEVAAGVTLTTYPPAPGPLGTVLRASGALAAALDEDAARGGVLHTHGLWLMPNVYPARSVRRSGGEARIVHSVHGMLATEALKFAHWKKRLFWLALQRRALAEADCLHATAAAEYADIRASGLGNPVAIIPNGVEAPDLAAAPRPSGPQRTVLFFGRIHPIKGLDNLIRAWAAVEAGFPDWRLRIVGPVELGYDEKLRRLADQLGVRRAGIEGPIWDAAAKLEAYRQADLFVLPSRNENFGVTVAEVLAAEVPVIATRGAPWAGLEAEGCGWWIDHGPEPLAAALRDAMARPRPALRAMGARGRVWVMRDFSWGRVAADMLDVYRWLACGGERPGVVRLD